MIPRPETELLVEEVLAFLDQEVLGEAGTPPRDRAPLPWNAEVEKARQAEAAAAQGKTDEAAVAASDGVSAAVDWGHEEQVFGASGTADAIVDGDLDAEAAGAETAGAETDASSDGLSEAPRIAHVLEVGTGTGCISLSLAYERPERVTCVATDIEPRAIALASRNRNALGISTEVVDFREGNLVSPLDREQEWGTFDVLVSNPPYIPTQVMKGLPHEVADYEPALALDGGADGLDIFRRLVKAAPSMLRTGGLLACELYEGHLELAAEVCRQGGLEDIRIVNDLTGRPRIILARAYRVREVATAR